MGDGLFKELGNQLTSAHTLPLQGAKRSAPGMLSIEEEQKQRERQGLIGGALGGAATGASAGFQLGGAPGAVIGGLGGAVAGGVFGKKKAAGSAVEQFQDAQLSKEMRLAEQGRLGLTGAEKDRQIAAGQQAALTQVQGQQAELARAQASGAAPLSGGGFSQLQRQLAGTEAQAGVGASQQVEQASREREAERFGMLREDLAAAAPQHAARNQAARDQLSAGFNKALNGFQGIADEGGFKEMLAGITGGNNALSPDADVDAMTDATNDVINEYTGTSQFVHSRIGA
jgi:hypothetical protein